MRAGVGGWVGGGFTGVMQPLSHCGGGQSAEAGRLPTLALSLSLCDAFVHPLV